MDKNAIKKYAVWARRELISRVSQKALQYGITEENTVPANATNVNGVILSNDEMKQRRALIERITDKGYQQVMEEVAYTWFNRFIALRFMEVNGYLPSHVRVFTDDENNFKPQILAEAINLDFDGLNMDKVYELKDANDNEALFKYLLIVQCNALNPIMPRMFQKISDYTELLFPDNLLREGSVVQQMIELIPEEDWKDAVQIIGWLYQYYNIEPKAKVFSRPSTQKISKEEVPAATQLFTPDWIVRYMVENSLGRLWLEGHTNEELRAEWEYYLDEVKQKEEIGTQLATIRNDYTSIGPEQIKCIDPCSGSGHILAYMFDVLIQIYEAYGYSAREATASIVENNIYGLDIDERAAQLAYFSVMMKARQYDRRFFNRKDNDGNLRIPQPRIFSIVESNGIDEYSIDYFVNGDKVLKSSIGNIIKALNDAKEYGSLLEIPSVDYETLYDRIAEIRDDINISRDIVLDNILPLIDVAKVLSEKYDIVVTNPPYMGSRKGMNAKLKKYVEKNYPDSKSDLYTCFIERCLNFSKKHKFVSMITMQSFMFTDDYKELRAKLLHSHSFVNMAHLGADAFSDISGEVVQTVAFTIGTNYHPAYIGRFVRLVDHPCDEKPLNLQNKSLWYKASSKVFDNIKATPISYWLSETMRHSFDIGVPFEEYGKPRAGITTGENDRFLRLWHEVERDRIGIGYENVEAFHNSGKLYIPYNKGGIQIKWFGNNDYVIMFDKHNYNVLANQGNHLPSRQYYCRECMTWSDISGRTFAARYCTKGFVFDVKGSCGFPDEGNLWLTLAFLNSKLTPRYIDSLNPTTTTQVGDLKRIPIIPPTQEEKNAIDKLSQECVRLAKKDWDSFETSWDFASHPLVIKNSLISDVYDKWQATCEESRRNLKRKEEEINKLFITMYNLQDEIDEIVSDREINLRKADKTKDVKSLISYAVGCMFGRYSLDIPGLIYAGGKWDDSKYSTLEVDKDSIIPISDDEYFEDDIVSRFVHFIEVVYGRQFLEENLQFIADALGGSGQSREIIRKYFMNDFFTDHCKMYQKHPIYWLFDSGKKNGFKALVYMHRYQPDTIARMRTDYVHEQQSRYRTAIADLEQRIASAATSERVKLNKKLKTLKDQAAEIQVYEEKIHHFADQYISIDLDDGVKANYAKFQDILAKIK